MLCILFFLTATVHIFWHLGLWLAKMEIMTLKDEVKMKNEQIASLEKQIAEFTLSPREKMENQEETVVSLASSTSKKLLPFQTKQKSCFYFEWQQICQKYISTF